MAKKKPNPTETRQPSSDFTPWGVPVPGPITIRAGRDLTANEQRGREQIERAIEERRLLEEERARRLREQRGEQ